MWLPVPVQLVSVFIEASKIFVCKFLLNRAAKNKYKSTDLSLQAFKIKLISGPSLFELSVDLLHVLNKLSLILKSLDPDLDP